MGAVLTISTCNQSASCSIVVLHAFPSSAKSADNIEGAMIAGGGILGEFEAIQGKRGWRKSCEIFQYGEKSGRMSTGLISRRCTTSSEALEIWPDVC